jgi:hypothetical protein
MSILKRIAPAVALLAALSFVQVPAAQSIPIRESSVTTSTTVSKQAVCNNKVVRWIYAAGFRGKSLRIGWAIVMRESGGNPRNISNGADYGLWQINVPTHPGYSYSALMDPIRNSKIAYKLSKRGTSFRPWGIGVTSSGRVYMDSRDYDGIWNSWKKQNWIWKPFIKYYRAYPC